MKRIFYYSICHQNYPISVVSVEFTPYFRYHIINAIIKFPNNVIQNFLQETQCK